jgi:alpha-L-fucosidase
MPTNSWKTSEHLPSGSSRAAWLREARFGLFLHWGLYSVAGRHEWVKNRERMSDERYDTYLRYFTADRFDADALADLAYRAGMRYAVLTAKHHEGFCLWDSAFTDYKATNTPAARDLVAEFVAAFRKRGLKVGLYYSLLDWRHPHFTIDGYHPQFDRTDPDQNARRDMAIYRTYMHGQVNELVERFHPDVLWFDFSYPSEVHGAPGKGQDDWGSADLVDEIRKLDPFVLINDRLGLAEGADFVTPEEVAPSIAESKWAGDVPWEACRTLNGSWGYAPQFSSWLDAGQVVRLLADAVSRGGNLLLNIGPTARGQIEPKACRLIEEVGGWMADHQVAIYGADRANIPAPVDCRVTRVGDRWYVHVFAWPSGQIELTNLPGELEFARFVHDGVEIEFDATPADAPFNAHDHMTPPPGAVTLKLPRQQPDVLLPTVELFFRGAAA